MCVMGNDSRSFASAVAMSLGANCAILGFPLLRVLGQAIGAERTGPASIGPPAREKHSMYVGTQNQVTTDDEYRQLAQLGVRHINADPDGNPHDWTLDDLKRHRDRMERCGLILDMVQLPLSS